MAHLLVLAEHAGAVHHTAKSGFTVPAQHQNLIERRVAAAANALALQTLLAQGETHVIPPFREVFTANEPQHDHAPKVNLANAATGDLVTLLLGRV